MPYENIHHDESNGIDSVLYDLDISFYIHGQTLHRLTFEKAYMHYILAKEGVQLCKNVLLPPIGNNCRELSINFLLS
jgi:hypothetical protein